MTRTLKLPDHYDFAGTLGPLSLGRIDPSCRVTATELAWALHTPNGPATLHLRRVGDAMQAQGHGPGADWVLEQSDGVVGLRDDVSGFDAVAALDPLVRRAWHERPGLRMTRTGRLFAHLLPTILAQKVTGKEAAWGYARLVRKLGTPAPGGFADLLVPPTPQLLAATPYWAFHPFGVEQKRADTVRRVASAAERLESAPDPATATSRLTAIRGIGVWTAAEAVRLGYGDPDAVSVGDYNIPHHVVFALTGAVRAGSRESTADGISAADARMLELLEPFRGHRARVVQLLIATHPGPPRFGPRMPIRSFATF